MLDGFISCKIYDKRDDFDFEIVNFPYLDPRRASYNVYISQLIRLKKQKKKKKKKKKKKTEKYMLAMILTLNFVKPFLVGENKNVIRQTACTVVNPITVKNFASLFGCTPAGRASDFMTAPN